MKLLIALLEGLGVDNIVWFVDNATEEDMRILGEQYRGEKWKQK